MNDVMKGEGGHMVSVLYQQMKQVKGADIQLVYQLDDPYEKNKMTIKMSVPKVTAKTVQVGNAT